MRHYRSSWPGWPGNCFLCLVLSAGAWASNKVTCSEPTDPKPIATEYWVSLENAARHTALISIRFPQTTGGVKLAMPVWNALYQVRNFAANIEDVTAEDSSGAPAQVTKVGTSEWQVTAPAGCMVVHYDIHLDIRGPFGSQLNEEHAFLNWAMVLMYSPELRGEPARVRFDSLRPGWKVRDLHLCHEISADSSGRTGGAAGQQAVACDAANYDELVDSPVEIGRFQEFSFQQDGAVYHIVVDGSSSSYDSGKLQDVLKRITHAGVDWMQNRPYDDYTFIYHFPESGAAGGGMEHAYGTAIDMSAATVKQGLGPVGDVSAHEFFHLWNVKRIRPQSLEPVDYQNEQDTRALWFSEGVTSTVGDLLRSRAGLIDEAEYLRGVAGEITDLESRPAHVWQSAEESSLDAWFEGNAFYRTPERSISYYNKGDVLGVLLDLRLRGITQGGKSLRDLFQWLNEHYAMQHKFFPDSGGVQQAAESVTGQSFAEFFRDYVVGVKPIPYGDFFRFVGLQLASTTATVAAPGFTTTTNLGGQPEVVSVQANSDAAHAGVRVGDRIVEANGQPAGFRFDGQLAALAPGDTLKLIVANARGEHKLKIKLGSRQVQEYVLQDVPGVTAEQLAHRKAWIHGDDEAAGAP